MKIEYQDKGSTAQIVIASFITERRKHNRCVDAALLATPVRASSSGVFFRRTVITGKSNHMMRAYKIICKEANSDR
ncbi:hypothetical protein [Xenorhabdus bovienii]|uniref:hypothetical protein n=1 Tax=Xenorhabdus bovienii TaxID=40576 RepID=UPI00237CDC63|nr:hypothetical protein [Xenorhabdus bovienii]MDE1476398.1 hypothetical protein [Xenorhabdus bovienii]MDE1484338.1 hypothetical protein [Xenorhabdus bovienii]MDE9443651.1 hypothetical protein [Xenorhabdus bovienii]MDE9458821.1 hypothetical protein [Xenorhabdus bovienii]MDE9487130.1 hypothetical protein [Xenorhabdus bovienii]